MVGRRSRSEKAQRWGIRFVAIGFVLIGGAILALDIHAATTKPSWQVVDAEVFERQERGRAADLLVTFPVGDDYRGAVVSEANIERHEVGSTIRIRYRADDQAADKTVIDSAEPVAIPIVGPADMVSTGIVVLVGLLMFPFAGILARKAVAAHEYLRSRVLGDEPVV